MIEKLKINSLDKGKRVDVFLAEKYKDLTRSYISKLNDQNKILVNNKKVKNGYKLEENDEIIVDIQLKPQLSYEAEDISIEVIYEDADLIIINKPQGLCVHPAVKNEHHTLVNALMFKYKELSDINGEFRPGIVHRLDKDTSGLMIVAKNNFAHINLQKQIQTKTCKRKYLALVIGSFKEDSGVINKNLKRSKKNRLKYEVCANFEGRTAITNYKTLEKFKGFSLVEFSLQTGRTHQIRVHSSFMGHPIVGDKLYGVPDKFNLQGQLLTSYSLSLISPSTNKELHFEIDLPLYFTKILQNLRELEN